MNDCNKLIQKITKSATALGRWSAYGVLLFLCVKMLATDKSNMVMSIKAGTKEDMVMEVKKVALTYDDGPHPTYTNQILEVLKAKDAPATFFLIGNRVESYPQVVEDIYADGHVLGNHTYSHCDLCVLSDAEQHEELERTSQLIEDITGERPDYIRAPFGKFPDSKEMDAYIQVDWSVDTLDWTGVSVETIVANMISEVKNNGIILMHDQYPATVEATAIIIDWLRENGYEIVPLEEIYLGY